MMTTLILQPALTRAAEPPPKRPGRAHVIWPHRGGGQAEGGGGDNGGEGEESGGTGGNDLRQTYTEPWIFGLGSPALAADIGARGIRIVIDLNEITVDGAVADLRRAIIFKQGVCMTLRWKDPDDGWYDRLHVDEATADARLDSLMEILTCEEAETLGDKLWIQFYNEVTGGPGTILPEHTDQMLDFASRAAARIRAEAPTVSICGAALTGFDVLATDPAERDEMAWSRYDGLTRIMDWSLEHADAIDMHLHTDSSATLRNGIRLVREAMAERPGDREFNKSFPLVCFEWSPAKYPNRDDDDAVRRVMKNIWVALNEGNVKIAAYGNYYVPEELSETFQWKNITTLDGSFNEPIYETFVAITQDPAAMAKRDRKGKGDESSSGAGDEVDGIIQ